MCHNVLEYGNRVLAVKFIWLNSCLIKKIIRVTCKNVKIKGDK